MTFKRWHQTNVSFVGDEAAAVDVVAASDKASAIAVIAPKAPSAAAASS